MQSKMSSAGNGVINKEKKITRIFLFPSIQFISTNRKGETKLTEIFFFGKKTKYAR